MSMKTIALKQLAIRNFKGIRELTLDLNGESANIYGDNATGKTTIYDAFTWLLFGKDSNGSSKFSVKPVGAQAGVSPEVSATLIVDGAEIKLQKVLREKWEKHRGDQERYAGNTVDYFIDGVPHKESRYKAAISAIIPEDSFRMLTSVSHFCREIHYKNRREILFEMSDIPDDSVLLSNFPELSQEVGSRSVSDFRAMIQRRRKDLNTTSNAIPARIDECDHQIAQWDSVDFDKAQAGVATLNSQKQDLEVKLSAIVAGSGRTVLESELRELSSSLSALEAENSMHRASQSIPVVDERPALRERVLRLQESVERYEQMLDDAQHRLDRVEQERENLKRQWAAENQLEFESGVCEYCGQPLPPELEKRSREQFEARKAERLKVIERDGFEKTHQIEEAQAQISRLADTLQGRRAELDEAQGCMDAYVSPEIPVIEDLPDYAAKRAEIEEQMRQKKAQLDELGRETGQATRRIRENIEAIQKQISEKLQIIAGKTVLESALRRVDELKDQQRKTAAEIERIDTLLDLCDDYSRFKVDHITGAINHNFRMARFRLFTETINGSVQDCCDVMVNGVPYEDANNAAKINVGIDVIRALSRHYGIRVPLFIDNAESVTHPQEIDTQVIRLVVSETDKELRIE